MRGTPPEREWARISLAHVRYAERAAGIGYFNQQAQAFADVRAPGITYENCDDWRVVAWESYAGPDPDVP
jgi:hypothetical protein